MKNRRTAKATAGLPGAPSSAEDTLREKGIDPDRLPIFYLGLPRELLKRPVPPWGKRIALGFFLWLVLYSLNGYITEISPWFDAASSLLAGLIILQGACEALVSATEKIAARWHWSHYTAGTVAEILSTLPELIVIGFVAVVSPVTAFVITLVTIYNNALVFSLYSYFLPKDQQGRFLMPRPITEIGSKLLVAGSTIGLVLGIMMLGFSSAPHTKTGMHAHDLLFLAAILLCIFVVYLYRLVKNYASEEQEVRDALDMSDAEIEQRVSMVYKNVAPSSLLHIAAIFLIGVAAAVAGGERVADFAELAIDELGLNDIWTALILAGFAGMSEYVILWHSHRKKEYGIALANAFGGITQVMFLVLPFTLLSISAVQLWGIGNAAEYVTIPFSLSNFLLLVFLFPTFYTLVELIKDDHTFDILDTTIMSLIVILLIALLVTYGAESLSLHAPA